MTPESRVKRRKSLEASADLISELPREVIDAILERLPLRDAAKMSVLSQKWLDIWTSIHQLTFDAYFFASVLKDKMQETHMFCRIVSKILFHHEGHLFRFHLYVPALRSYPDVNQWIWYLSRSVVSDLSIQSQYKVPLKLSSKIFSFGNLEKLKLHHCVINPPPYFRGFGKMTTLELDKVTIGEKAFKNLVRSCPLLQKLRLTNFMGMEHIVIDAPRLSRLVVDGTFTSLDVRHSGNLVSAVIGLQNWVKVSHRASLRALINALASSCKIEKLSFRGHFCKMLRKEYLLPTTFEKVRNLDLSSIHLNDLDDFSSVMSTIQSCPNIEMLFICVSTSRRLTVNLLDYNRHFVLHNLRRAYVRICCGSSVELKLIEYLLGCSPLLETFSVTNIGHLKPSFQSRMVMQLIRFRRASQKAEVICPEPIFSDILDDSDVHSSSSSEDIGESNSD